MKKLLSTVLCLFFIVSLGSAQMIKRTDAVWAKSTAGAHPLIAAFWPTPVISIHFTRVSKAGVGLSVLFLFFIFMNKQSHLSHPLEPPIDASFASTPIQR